MTSPDTTVWTYGEPPPPQPEPQPDRIHGRRVLGLFGCCVLLGAALAPLAGWVWVTLANPPTVPLASDGGLYLGEQALNQQSGVTLWFFVVGVAFGAVAGLVVGWFGQRFGWPTVLAVLRALCDRLARQPLSRASTSSAPMPQAAAANATVGTPDPAGCRGGHLGGLPRVADRRHGRGADGHRLLAWLGKFCSRPLHRLPSTHLRSHLQTSLPLIRSGTSWPARHLRHRMLERGRRTSPMAMGHRLRPGRAAAAGARREDDRSRREGHDPHRRVDVDGRRRRVRLLHDRPVPPVPFRAAGVRGAARRTPSSMPASTSTRRPRRRSTRCGSSTTSRPSGRMPASPTPTPTSPTRWSARRSTTWTVRASTTRTTCSHGWASGSASP